MLFGADRAGVVFRRPQFIGVNLWLSWSDLSSPAAVGAVRSVAAERNADGFLSLFGVGLDGKVWQRKQTSVESDTYSEWALIPGQVFRP